MDYSVIQRLFLHCSLQSLVHSSNLKRKRQYIMAVTLTTAAAQRVRQHLKKRGSGEGLRFGVKSSGCTGFGYVVDFADEVGENDHVFLTDGIKVIVDDESLTHVDGTSIDFRKEGFSESFKFNNPNVINACGCGESFSTE